MALERLGRALTRAAEAAQIRRLAREEADRLARLGDLEGQTARANAFSAQLEGSLAVATEPPLAEPPSRWPF